MTLAALRSRIDLSPAWRISTLWALMLLSLVSTVAAADSPVASRLDPASLVHGFIDFTRWPGPKHPAQLCASKGGAYSERLDVSSLPAGGRRLPLRLLSVDVPIPAGCDVFVFEGWSGQAQRAALKAAAGQAILTIGFGAEFCSDGGTICLGESAEGWTFEINSDAVARSGLRINPRVLQLARPRSRST